MDWGAATARERILRHLAALAACLCALSAPLLLASVPQPAAAAFADQCSSPDRTLTPTTSTIAVGPGETVLLTGGTFPGGIDALPAGGTLCVAAGVVLQPPYMNNAEGALVVASGAQLILPFVSVGAGFAMTVEGTARAQGLNINGSSLIDVAAGGELVIAQSFSPSVGQLRNAGSLHVTGVMNENSGFSILNSGLLTVDGDATVNGRLTNSGIVRIAGTLIVNGSGVMQNDCALTAAGDLSNNGPSSSNQGLVLIGGRFGNNGTWSQSAAGMLDAATLTADGKVTGYGQYRFSGSTSVQGSFTGLSAGSPIVVDSTAPSDRIFDVQTGTVVNVVRGTVEPFTELSYPAPECALPRPSADVMVGKTGPATVTENSALTYSISVTNIGPAPAEGVVVTDALPPGLVGVTASAGGVVGATTVTWSLGTLPAGSNLTLSVTGTAASPVGTALTDTASAASATPDPDPGNNDGTSESSRSTTVVVPVVLPNTAPEADDTAVQGVTGEPILGTVTASDAQAGQVLTFSLVSGPSNGRLTMMPGGALEYRSAPAFTGIDSATFRVCDNGSPSLCDEGTITITVFPGATDAAAQTFQDQPVLIPLLADHATPGAALIGTPSVPPAHGVVVLDSAAGTAIYTPDPGFLGSDSFGFRVCSPTAPAVCDDAVVAITVLRLNLPPVVEDLTLRTTVRVPVQDRLSIVDPEGDPFVAARGVPPRSGTATVDAVGLTEYAPLNVFAGRDQYSVFACDQAVPQLCSTGLVTVEIVPLAVDDAATTSAGIAVTVDVTANDTGSVTPPSVLIPPAHGSAELVGRSFTYLPDPGFVGTDTFTYRICAVNAADLCAEATVSVVVSAAPVAPGPGPTPPVTSAAGGDDADSPLAGTGSQVGGWGWLGLSAVCAGAGLLGFRRLRLRSRREPR